MNHHQTGGRRLSKPGKIGNCGVDSNLLRKHMGLLKIACGCTFCGAVCLSGSLWSANGTGKMGFDLV